MKLQTLMKLKQYSAELDYLETLPLRTLEQMILDENSRMTEKIFYFSNLLAIYSDRLEHEGKEEYKTFREVALFATTEAIRNICKKIRIALS